MFRLLFYLILTVFVISIIRMVAGVLLKGLATFLGGTLPAQGNTSHSVPVGGELKKDPVCGTFVSTATSVKKTVGAGVVHFCSVECRDKFRA